MDIEFDFKGDPVGGVITNCKLFIYHCMQRTSDYYQKKSVGCYDSLSFSDWEIEINLLIIDIYHLGIFTQYNVTNCINLRKLTFVYSEKCLIALKVVYCWCCLNKCFFKSDCRVFKFVICDIIGKLVSFLWSRSLFMNYWKYFMFLLIINKVSKRTWTGNRYKTGYFVEPETIKLTEPERCFFRFDTLITIDLKKILQII